MLKIEVIRVGIQGMSGPGIYSGSGLPSADMGRDGAFYIDTDVWQIYGPKAAGDWGNGTDMLAALTPTSLLAVIDSMSAEQITALRAKLGIPTYANRADANFSLENGDGYFDLSKSRVTTATA